jgi:ubiquinone/menaquinone biosynthesis C-methylase UbiE
MALVEATVFSRQREAAVAGLRGRVVEFGVGTGLNLPYYYPEAEVTGIDLSGGMLQRARERVRDLAREERTQLIEGNVENTGLESGCYDAVVSTYTLCNVESPVAALSEARRLLRPDGVLVLVEHTGSTWAPLDAVLAYLDRWSGPHWGEHLRRDHGASAREAGFRLEYHERRRAGLVELVRARPL